MCFAELCCLGVKTADLVGVGVHCSAQKREPALLPKRSSQALVSIGPCAQSPHPIPTTDFPQMTPNGFGKSLFGVVKKHGRKRRVKRDEQQNRKEAKPKKVTKQGTSLRLKRELSFRLAPHTPNSILGCRSVPILQTVTSGA